MSFFLYSGSYLAVLFIGGLRTLGDLPENGLTQSPAVELQPPAGRVQGAAAWSGRTNVTEKWETVGRYKRKLPARYESAVLHNPYLGCKHNVKEVPLAWQQLQFFAIYCYLTGSPHDKGN